jgi:hypothetical protein
MELDERKAECPYCQGALKKIPGSKTKCPLCGNFMFVRTRRQDRVRVVVTQEQAEKIDRDWSEIAVAETGPDPYDTEEQGATRIAGAQALLDRWRIRREWASLQSAAQDMRRREPGDHLGEGGIRMGFFKPAARPLKRYLMTRVPPIAGISDGRRRKVRDIVAWTLALEGTGAVTNRLREVLPDFTETQLKTISHTETMTAFNHDSATRSYSATSGLRR